MNLTNRPIEVAGLAGILGTTEVLVSVYGITPYTYLAAWLGIGCMAIAVVATVLHFRSRMV